MRVKCPRCPAEIEVKVSSLHPTLRWGTSDLPLIESYCLGLADGTATRTASGTINCQTLERAVALAATGAPS